MKDGRKNKSNQNCNNINDIVNYMLDSDDDLNDFSLDDDDSEVDSEWEYESDVDIQDRAGANNDEITDEPEMLMEHDDVDPPLSTTTEDENNEINTLQPEEVASTSTTNSEYKCYK